MNIKIKNSFLFIILIILIGQTQSQQIQYSRPMIAVKKHQPAYEILINGKKLNPSVYKDIIRIDIQQRINNPGSFKIKLYDRDNSKSSLKNSKSSLFNLEDKIEISIMKDNDKPSPYLFKSAVTSINQYTNESDSSFLIIEGSIKKPDIKYPAESQKTVYKIDSSNRDQFTLKRKRINDQIEVSWSGKNDGVGLPDIRTGRLIQLYGVGHTFRGLYYVSEITHSFTTSGYITHFKLTRNTTND